MRVTGAHGTPWDLAAPPRRVISLVSSATEVLFELGCGDSVIGVTPYCGRYVEGLAAPVVGDYLHADAEALRALEPDLILVTSGIQAALGRRLAEAGLPVYALPLPASRFGILENQVAIGGLMHRVGVARALSSRMEAGFAELMASVPKRRPKTFIEMWCGRHLRAIGGLSFIHDLLELAGGEPVPTPTSEAYPRPDLEAVAAARPDAIILFQEPEHPVDGATLLAERGWTWGPRLIDSGIAKGRNIIHDGPSYLETARWLRRQLSG
ncbi:iron ABC transporter substrate-binding protein [Geothrix oryzae]|uniref:Iron ABC transporter substrate-binding protein n=1 Tax=Geothrix oryzae TaxID=2927975 RepID=A0ABN6UU14_9BACT|nr:helical backbone metal receptor [Geothrix oryzae]BDU68234.1 iron ABC transporter substrate-binding protein [Geothrix oryzae]